MSITVNGSLYKKLLDFGIRNLALHVKEVNELNVFPVPDGDTGTNMVTTLQNGYAAVKGEESLCDVCRCFARAVVFGARGNSGVIVSQFFKGLSKALEEAEDGEADGARLILGFEKGVRAAYRAVSHPAEGTVLTVLRESTEYVRESFPEGADVVEIHCAFLERGRISLKNTPTLLPVLAEAGVVDSGGMGIVYVFEGMCKCLAGEQIDTVAANHADCAIDFGAFDENSSFDLGYCSEFLLQLTASGEAFSLDGFVASLNALGDSVAVTEEGSKVKAHVHTRTPAPVLAEAQRFGEFLTLKIENMSVQHTAREKDEADTAKESRITYSLERGGAVAVIACAPDKKTRDLFHSMGADAVICCPSSTPTTKDFLEAAQGVHSSEIVLFPNYKNNILPAHTSAKLLRKEGVNACVVETKSIAECYAALAIADLDAALAEELARDAEDALGGLHIMVIRRAVKDATVDGVDIRCDDYLAMDGDGVAAADSDLLSLVRRVTDSVAANEEDEPETVTVFMGKNTDADSCRQIEACISESFEWTETDTVKTDSPQFDLILAFDFS